jgi:uncharacterized protein YndB with AHSA1/START domain
MATTTDTPAMEREVVLTRRIAAPRALVFRALTDPEHLVRWWGPHGYTAKECTVDLRFGGALSIVMQGPAGERHPMTGVIDDLQPPERFGYTFEAHLQEGVIALRGHNAIILTEANGHTELTLTARATGLLPPTAFMLQGMQAGWSQSLDRLSALLA